MTSKEDQNVIRITRIIRRFLFFPLTLEGQTRWLETAYIEQAYCVSGTAGILRIGWRNRKWKNQCEWKQYKIHGATKRGKRLGCAKYQR